MNLLNKLTIKNLKLNKKRTIVTIIGIMLSVALITAVASVYTSGIKSLARYEAKEMGNFHIAFYNVNEKDIASISNNKAVEDFYLVRSIGYAKIESKNEYKPYAYIKAFNEKALNELSINLVEGRMPENENEILIPMHLKTNGRSNISVGDVIKLDIGDRVLDDTYLYQESSYQEEEKFVAKEKHTYTVVGIIERPASNIEGYSAPGYTFITYDENIRETNYDVYTRYTKDGLKHFYEVTGNLLGIDGKEFEKCYGKDEAVQSDEAEDRCIELASNAKYDGYMNQYLVLLETNPYSGELVNGLDIFAIVVCIIIVFTSVFCIKNSFDISITEKIKQYGMLKSIGSTHKQIKKNVFFEATMLGLFGIPLGILLGFLASFILMLVSNLFVGDMLGIKLAFEFSWLAVIVAILLGVVTVYLSALSSARKASKVSPIDSIRNSANIKINGKKLKTPKIIDKIFGVGGTISYKNLKRNKKKYRTTVISIIVSVFIFIALSSFMDMIFRSIKEDYKTTDYNLSIDIGDLKEKDEHILNDIVLDSTVDEYVISKTNSLNLTDAKISQDKINYGGESTNFDINIISLNDEQYKKYIKSLNLKYDDVKNKIILIDTVTREVYNDNSKKYEKHTYRYFDYKKGDVLRVEIDKNLHDLEIGCITDVRPFGYTNPPAFPLVVMSNELFKKFEIGSYEVLIKTTDANKLQDDAEKILKDYHFEINNVDRNYRMVNNLYTLVAIFLYGFIIVISLIGITNIFNTITTNMELRKREFAMLKSVGMTKKEFNRMIRLESLFMGVKSLFYGILIGTLLSYLVYKLIDENFITYHLPFKGIIISIVVVFMLIFMIMKYSISKINKQNTIETIRNENI